MNVNVDAFTDDQKKFLRLILSDLGGPTATSSLLRIIECVVYELKPDFVVDPPIKDDGLLADLEVCMAALAYMKVQDVAGPNA